MAESSLPADSTVLAIFIDPSLRSFTPIRVGTDLKAIYEALGCSRITSSGRPLNGSLEQGFDSIFVRDEDLDATSNSPRYWFQVDADRNSPSSYPIGSKGLGHGTDRTGEMCDVGIGIDELKSRITFTERKFRGFTKLRPISKKVRRCVLYRRFH
jgi:hypothetical protein